jgi:hypothetical protein
MEKPTLRSRVREKMANLQLADLPQSSQLSELLEQLQIERLGQLETVSIADLRRASKAADALTLELGCLLFCIASPQPAVPPCHVT